MAAKASESTEVGSYFVANYPPFSAWNRDCLPAALDVLQRKPGARTTVGLYAHIPFCRKRCKFCYYRVYTDKSRSDRDRYLDALGRELNLYSRLPVIAGRPLRFIYVGGGTPSALNEDQIERLGVMLRESWNWKEIEEFTFECEPGTLTQRKVELIREIGVTRISLGIENFSDEILKENGRAHLSPEVYSAYDWIRECDFQQVNIDLIAGMAGETDRNWSDCVDRSIQLEPDSVTVYQMELPYNTIYSRAMLEDDLDAGVASWPRKRRWAREAFDALAGAGYEQGSAYTMVRPSPHSAFVYRDALWCGGDMIGAGVASFGYLQGAHVQNLDSFDPYVDSCEQDRLPLNRACLASNHQQLIRELILQMKLGRVAGKPFQDKFGVDIFAEFDEAFRSLQDDGLLIRENGTVTLTPDGMLRVDECLPRFYESEYRGARYT